MTDIKSKNGHKLGPFGHEKAFGGMVGRCMPNSGYGGRLGTRVMTTCMFYGSTQIPNIQYFVVYGGLWSPGGISFFFSSNFPSNAVRIMSGDSFSTPVLTIFINVIILNFLGLVQNKLIVLLTGPK